MQGYHVSTWVMVFMILVMNTSKVLGDWVKTWSRTLGILELDLGCQGSSRDLILSF
jgi:hypothetical protein